MARIRIRSALAAVVGVLVVLSACTPPEPPPPPPPSATTPTPSVDQEKADYEAATEVYRKANQLVDEALQRGEGKLPAELANYADPNGAWYKRQEEGVAVRAEEGIRTTGLSTVSTAFAAPGQQYSADRLAMYVCVDGSNTHSTDASGKSLGNGHLASGVLEFRRNSVGRTDGNPDWRVTNYVGEPGLKAVEKCEQA